MKLLKFLLTNFRVIFHLINLSLFVIGFYLLLKLGIDTKFFQLSKDSLIIQIITLLLNFVVTEVSIKIVKFDEFSKKELETLKKIDQIL